MTTRYKTKAFIFKKKEINESNRNFSVFTEEFGRMEIFAKAIRKNASKLRNGVDIFNLSEIEFIQGRNRKTLTDAVAIEKFSTIPQDLEKFKIANAVGEVLEDFIKGEEKDREIFNLLRETFSRLNNQNAEKGRRARIYYYFLWNILSLLGYKPEVDKCATCRSNLNPLDIYFSNKSGGVICKKCLNHDNAARKINSDVAKVLRLILKKDWQTISRIKVGPSSQKLLEDISDTAVHFFCPAHC